MSVEYKVCARDGWHQQPTTSHSAIYWYVMLLLCSLQTFDLQKSQPAVAALELSILKKIFFENYLFVKMQVVIIFMVAIECSIVIVFRVHLLHSNCIIIL